MGLGLATKAFFKILFDDEAASAYRQAMETKGLPEPASSKAAQLETTVDAVPDQPRRSEAISLLAALQREARFIDLVKESLDDYSDEQVGAAARDVLRDAGKVVERIFGIVPLTDAEEGSPLQTPDEINAGRIRLTGNVHGDGPFRGNVAHHGWEASRCDVPTWSGTGDAVRVIAPIELEIS